MEVLIDILKIVIAIVVVLLLIPYAGYTFAWVFANAGWILILAVVALIVYIIFQIG